MTPAGTEPSRMAHRPHDKHHRPVPWFVALVDGVHDFRVMRPGAIGEAQARHLCWVCGVPFQRQEDRAFVIDPWFAAHRVSVEPPSHRECAIYSATACPFLATPGMTRRARNIPAAAALPAGTTSGNPGVAIVWVAGYRAWRPAIHRGRTVFDIGDPKEVLWFACGREATRGEALASVAAYLGSSEEHPGALPPA